MEKAKVSVIQLFSMMFIFELGSALVVSFGIGARKDAWFAILLGLCGGVALFFIYYPVFRQYPDLPFTGYARKIFGKYFGWGIGVLYIVYLMYAASRNLRDFGDILLASTMRKTPLLAVNILMILAICYVLYLGIEVLGRTAEVFIVVIIFFGVTGSLLTWVSGNVHLPNVQPFLEDGWKPILTTAFPITTFFPFGEMFAFSMVFPYLNQPQSLKKVWLSALISSGLILSYTTTLNIAVLGVEEVERATFPLLSTIGKINLMEFLQRLDAIAVLSFLFTTFFKVSIYFYGAVIGMVDLFKLKNHQQIILPAGIIIIFLSMSIASNFAEHIDEGLIIAPYYLHSMFLLIIPLLMLSIVIIRNHVKNVKNKAN
ncbi:GerAB/ArcD/ProY family transporter [Ectobacillus funiculus]|uniref:GerAB/ArcD/ProY family transporter n=1 Tax=Ectobacillus funiculus TaxID=137993 RepID=UPI00101B7ABC|nr:GerAB/ArcD/ProY family transporter [Ectobacillus funiculus]